MRWRIFWDSQIIKTDAVRYISVVPNMWHSFYDSPTANFVAMLDHVINPLLVLNVFRDMIWAVSRHFRFRFFIFRSSIFVSSHFGRCWHSSICNTIAFEVRAGEIWHRSCVPVIEFLIPFLSRPRKSYNIPSTALRKQCSFRSPRFSLFFQLALLTFFR